MAASIPSGSQPVSFREVAAAVGALSKPPAEGKGYLQLDKDQRTVSVLVGDGAKASKNMSAEKLSTLILESTEAAEKTNEISKVNVDLSEMVKGLETLRGRIIAKQKNMNPIKKFFLELFGIEDKSQKVIIQIDRTIAIVKKFSLEKEIKALEKEVPTLEKNLQMKETELQKTHAPKSRANQIEGSIEEIKKELEAKGVKTTGSTSLEVQLQKFKNEMEAKREVPGAIVEEKGGLKSVFKKIVTSSTAPQKAYQEAKSKYEKVKELIVQLGDKQKELQTDTDAQTKYHKHVDSLNKEITSLKEQINLKKAEIVSKRQELESLKRPHLESGSVAAIQLSPKSPPSNSKVMEILDSAPRAAQGIVLSIKASLGFDPKDMQDYVGYQHKTFFGFSVGQRSTINELTKVGMKKEELEEMLEGGNGVTNMAYLALQVEQQISQAKINEKPKEYIANLERMLADLKRSLIISLDKEAFEVRDTSARDQRTINNNAIASKYGHSTRVTATDKAVQEISDKTRDELVKMKPGERLFIPIGAEGHATLLCFEKGKDGLVTPVIYNTGLGAENFANIATELANAFRGQKGQVAPTKIRYPAFEITAETDLKSKIGGLFINSKNKDKRAITDKEQLAATKQGIKEMYRLAEASFGQGTMEGKKEVQFTGICSFKILTEVAEDTLGDDYNQFQHDFLVQVGEEFQETSESMLSQLGSETQTATRKLHTAMLEDNQKEIDRLQEKIVAAKAKK